MPHFYNLEKVYHQNCKLNPTTTPIPLSHVVRNILPQQPPLMESQTPSWMEDVYKDLDISGIKGRSSSHASKFWWVVARIPRKHCYIYQRACWLVNQCHRYLWCIWTYGFSTLTLYQVPMGRSRCLFSKTPFQKHQVMGGLYEILHGYMGCLKWSWIPHHPPS